MRSASVTASKGKRRRFQFSLRTLLIVVTVLTIPCAWLGRKIEQKRKEREAVAAIVKLGGVAWYNYETEGDGEPPGPDWLRKLLGENFFDEVVGVSLVPETGLVQLKALPQLQFIDLNGAILTDAGLGKLKGLTQLQELTLVYTDVNDAGLKYLEGLTQLRKLNLMGTHVTDAGMVNLKRMANLQELSVDHSGVTDAGLSYLQKTLPNCRISDITH